MSFGVFGKLPQKRDFIALGIPRQVLEPFETWLQSAVAASRAELGASWQDTYLVAPVWRYWIGADILGATCTGSIIPSVDGVGRFFPLTILYCADASEDVAPPPFDSRDAWHDAIEARLLSVLADNAVIEVEKLIAGLEQPAPVERPAPAPEVFRRGNVWQSPKGEAGQLFPTIIQTDYWSGCSSRSFWWTNGGGFGGPLLYSRNALPDPFFYVSMIRGVTG